MLGVECTPHRFYAVLDFGGLKMKLTTTGLEAPRSKNSFLATCNLVIFYLFILYKATHICVCSYMRANGVLRVLRPAGSKPESISAPLHSG